MSAENAAPKMVFSTDIISDPGIDQAGLLKLHYSLAFTP